MIFDLVGGTFDVSLLTIDGGIFEVKAELYRDPGLHSLSLSLSLHPSGATAFVRLVRIRFPCTKERFGKASEDGVWELQSGVRAREINGPRLTGRIRVKAVGENPRLPLSHVCLLCLLFPTPEEAQSPGFGHTLDLSLSLSQVSFD